MYGIYSIRQLPGPAATTRRGRSGHARTRQVGVVEASCDLEALEDYIFDRYLTTGNRQYAGHRVEWTTTRRYPDGWRPRDDADPGTRGRVWRAVVTLRNGSSWMRRWSIGGL